MAPEGSRFLFCMIGEPRAIPLVMPSIVEGSKGQLISVLRRHHDVYAREVVRKNCWIDDYILSTNARGGISYPSWQIRGTGMETQPA